MQSQANAETMSLQAAGIDLNGSTDDIYQNV